MTEGPKTLKIERLEIEFEMKQLEPLREGVMKYRKRPFAIEAMQFDGTEASASNICAWASLQGGRLSYSNIADVGVSIYINTEQDISKVAATDWVIRGIAGEFYRCSNGVFLATYEPIEEVVE